MLMDDLLQSLVDTKEGGTRYAFLLGAGASISSGVPGAKVLATEWLETIKENNPDGYKKLIERPEYKNGDIAALYSDVYSVRFPILKNGYQAIEKIMSDKRVWPNVGYSILAQVMNQKRHNLVVSTNFDRLTETALLFYQNVHARVIGHETMLDLIAIDDQQPSIAKVHRDMFFSPKSEELEALGRWPAFIEGVLSQYHLIVIGYGGNDPGLMSALNQALEINSNARIYWCHIDETIKPLQEFSEMAMSKVVTVKTPFFDELMLALGKKMEYPLLSKKFIEDAEKRQHAYDTEIEKLVKKASVSEDEEFKDTISQLVASSWWEVELGAQETKDLDKKESLYLAGMDKFPESHELVGNYALFLHETRKDYDEAEQHYKKAIKIDPNNANNNCNYALLLADLCKDDEAEQYFKKAIKSDPDHAIANGGYAVFLYAIRKNYDGAERYYKKALEVEPDDANFNGNYANLLKGIKDYDGAEWCYKKALEVEPDNANYNGNYAIFLDEIRQDYDGAERYYKKALEIELDHSNNNKNYSQFLIERGRVEEAKPYLERGKK